MKELRLLPAPGDHERVANGPVLVLGGDLSGGRLSLVRGGGAVSLVEDHRLTLNVLARGLGRGCHGPSMTPGGPPRSSGSGSFHQSSVQ